MSESSTSPPLVSMLIDSSDPTSSAEAFPVRTSALRARVRASLARALACGSSTQGSFASYCPDTSSWKTSQLSLVEGLGSYSETWPRSGMIAGGTAFQLPPSAPLTAEIGSTWSRGEYPTPSAIDYGTSQNEGQVPHARSTAGTPSLSTWERTSWPTPMRRDGQGGPSPSQNRDLQREALQWPTLLSRDARGPQSGQERQGGQTLSESAVLTWPTPTAGDGKRATPMMRGNESLPSAATQLWPTATAGDGRGSGSRASRGNEGNQANEGTSLTDATCRSGRPLQETCVHGGGLPASSQPAICRVAYGLSLGVDEAKRLGSRNARLRALGNAVVPQVAEICGYVIQLIEEALQEVA